MQLATYPSCMQSLLSFQYRDKKLKLFKLRSNNIKSTVGTLNALDNLLIYNDNNVK